MLRRTACLGALLLAALVPAACGHDDGAAESLIIGDTLTVYSSVPLRGPLEPLARDMVRAEKLALAEGRGRAGVYNVSFATLDSADPKTGRWDPAVIAANARAAVEDRQTVAYLGELEPGASAVSLPILNEGGILQVSPRDTLMGLTWPGARGEPDKYYPSGLRTFARMVPVDGVGAATLVRAMRGARVRRLVLADDRRLAGVRLADRIDLLAREAGIRVVERERLDDRDDIPDDLGAGVRAARADAFLYTGEGGRFAVDVLRRVHASAPRVALFGADGLTLAPGLAERIGAAGDRLVVVGVEPPRGEAVAGFERRFEDAYGHRPHPQAVLGYDAMRLVLDAIRRAGTDASSRRAVIRRALTASRAPRARFRLYRVEGRRLVRARPQL